MPAALLASRLVAAHSSLASAVYVMVYYIHVRVRIEVLGCWCLHRAVQVHAHGRGVVGCVHAQHVAGQSDGSRIMRGA